MKTTATWGIAAMTSSDENGARTLDVDVARHAAYLLRAVSLIEQLPPKKMEAVHLKQTLRGLRMVDVT